MRSSRPINCFNSLPLCPIRSEILPPAASSLAGLNRFQLLLDRFPPLP